MSQTKDSYYKQNKGRNNRNRGGGQPKRQSNTGGARSIDPSKDSSQKAQTSYVPKSATTAVVQTNGAAVPVAPRPTQPSAPFAFTNGASRALPSQAVPPRVQSAPPNLTEQQQSPIFYPQKTFNQPGPSHLPGMQAHPVPPHGTQPPVLPPSTQPLAGQSQPQQATGTPLHQGQPTSAPSSASAAYVPPVSQPSLQVQPQSQPPVPAQPQQPPSQVQPQQSQPQPQPPAQPLSQHSQPPLPQGYKTQAPYYPPAYGYGYPGQYQIPPMQMQQAQTQPPQQSQHGRGIGVPPYQLPPQARHQAHTGLAQPLSHGVPINSPLGAQPVSIPPTHGPMAPLVAHVPTGLSSMNRTGMPYGARPFSSTSPTRVVSPGMAGHAASVTHPMPVPRQRQKIAIINPSTGREVTNSPPKDTIPVKPSSATEEVGHSGPSETTVPDFQLPTPARPVIIQAPPPGMQKPGYIRKQEPAPANDQGASASPQGVSSESVATTKEEQEKEQQEEERVQKELKEKEEKERADKDAQQKAREEEERKQRAKEEQERREKEEKERQEREKLEAERLQKEKQEREIKEKEEAEKQRLQEEKEAKVIPTSPQPLETVQLKNEANADQDTSKGRVTETQSKDGRTEDAEKKKEDVKKPSRKEILKKADAGDFEAAHFDAYSSPESKEQNEGKSSNVLAAPQERDSPKTPEAPAEEDDWEANADADWEAKAEDELVLQKDNKDISLRPNFGVTGAFRSTLAPSKPGDNSWTPTNTSGKKMYERDFLLKFQPYCREKPSGLPTIEVILGYDDKKGASPKGKGQPQPSWLRGSGPAPPFAGSQRGARGSPSGRFTSFRGQRGAAGARGGGRGARGGLSKKPGKEDQAGLIAEPPVSSEKMWVRPSRRQGTEPHAEIYGKIRNILNKLTADKFAALSKQLVEVMKEEVKDTEILKGVITIIFQKALLEPGFCTMYAELCRVLERSCPPFETDKAEGKPQTFKRFLLNKCQEEFEQKPTDDKDSEITDPKLKAEQELKRKDRMIGNIIFIGELYKEKMLTDKIVHDCVFRRLLGDIKNPAEEDIEALCKLMTTIGKVLDTAKARGYMDAYFKRMKGLSENPKIPSRIRFLLADVIDLRNRGWDEKKQVDPRTARPAARPTAIATRRPGAGSAASPTPTQSGRASAPRAAAPSPGGWETVGTKSSRHEQSSKNQPMVLGPNSQMGGPMGSGGAKGWRDPSEKSQPKRAEGGSSRNMFSALAQERSPSLDRKLGDERDEGHSPRDAGRSPRGDRGSYKPKERAREMDFEEVEEEEQEPAPAKSNASWKEVEESSRILLLEYVDSHDTEEAIECFKELAAPQFHSNILKMAMVQALDLKEPERYLYAKLFKALFEEGLVTEQQFDQGFKAVFDDFDGIMEDAPRAPSVIGAFVGSGLLDGYMKLDAGFVQALEPLVASNQAEKLIAAAFATIVDSAGVEELREMYKSSGANIMDYFRPSNRTEEHLVQWLARYKLPSLSPTRQYETSLQKMIQQGEDPEAIYSWVEGNLESDVWSDGEVSFATTLCRFILDYTASKTVLAAGSFDTEEKMRAEENRLLSTYSPLLARFVSNFPDTQLQCLFTVQRFCFDNHFPKGFVESVFSQFYTHEVILEEVYRTWEADDSNSAPGKQRALAEVDAWLKRLGTQTEND